MEAIGSPARASGLNQPEEDPWSAAKTLVTASKGCGHLWLGPIERNEGAYMSRIICNIC